MKSGTHKSVSPAGIYVHWPFCARKCPYCDFYTFGAEHPNFSLNGRYLERLIDEIRTMPARFALNSKPRADTIYLGGGTPSLIEPDELRCIFAALEEVFDLGGTLNRGSSNLEITMEVNPTAADIERLAAARSLGVNRASVGVQSFNDHYLKILGRDHDAKAARQALQSLREIGFDNLSLDLMFGLPGQTLQEFRADLDEALTFNPDHISAYGLTLHDGTPFKRWHAEGKWKLPEPEIEAAQFEALMDSLETAGYIQYEISNWCKPDRPSRHNSKYWRACDVYSFGASAHGVLNGRRYANPRDLAAYLKGDPGGLAIPEPLPESPRAASAEIMMLAVRRTEGVAWGELNDWFAAWHPEQESDLRILYAAELKQLGEESLIYHDESTLRLARRGIMHADRVAEMFF